MPGKITPFPLTISGTNVLLIDAIAKVASNRELWEGHSCAKSISCWPNNLLKARIHMWRTTESIPHVTRLPTRIWEYEKAGLRIASLSGRLRRGCGRPNLQVLVYICLVSGSFDTPPRSNLTARSGAMSISTCRSIPVRPSTAINQVKKVRFSHTMFPIVYHLFYCSTHRQVLTPGSDLATLHSCLLVRTFKRAPGWKPLVPGLAS